MSLMRASVVIGALALCSARERLADILSPGNSTAPTHVTLVRKFTDVNGSVSFTILGGSNGSNHATTLLGGARVYASGVLLGTPTASAFDLDGVNGVGINDLSVWLSDFETLGSPAFGRSDFDGDGAVDINGLSVRLTAYGAGGSVKGCTSSCP